MRLDAIQKRVFRRIGKDQGGDTFFDSNRASAIFNFIEYVFCDFRFRLSNARITGDHPRKAERERSRLLVETITPSGS